MFGGVIGSWPGLCPPPESSVKESTSPLLLDVLLGTRLGLLWFEEGVRRPVGSDAENGESAGEHGDALLLDLLLIGFFSFELSEPPRLLRTPSRVPDLSCLVFLALEDGGTSFKNEMSTDSSIRL